MEKTTRGTRTRPWTGLALLAASAGLAPAPARGQDAPALADLAFMAGCWEGEFRARDGRQGVIEEHYTAPSDNVMLGTTRYLLDGRATQFELTSIRLGDEGVVLLPYPGGRASPDGFTLTRATGGVAVFEAPEHDFPKRIIYRTDGPDRLSARVDDGTDEGQGMEWRLARAACPGSP